MSAHSKVDLFVHFVWSTAGRRKVLLPQFIEAVHAAAAAGCRHERCEPLVVGGIEDHVHALVRLRATCIPARVVGVMKVFSSREAGLRSGIEGFHWQAGYGAFSLSSEDVASVANYLGRQREHHARNALVSHLEWDDGVTAPPEVGRRPF